LPQRPWITATVTLTVLIIVYHDHEMLSSFSAYRDLHSTYPFYFAESLVAAWLVYRWQALWVAVLLPICMNLWWELFSVPRNSTGEWLPFAL
jgi:hypothetical protein